jgi:macrolide transport system ATP-binding/permease protein
MPSLIHLDNLTKIYLPQGKQDPSLGVRALDGVTLDIQAGEYVSIVGPSGSGKSTLMQILGLLDRASGGKFELAGQDVARLSDDQLALLRNSRIGFVFQFFNLLARTTALNNVALPLIYARIGDPESRARKMLEWVGLKDRLYHAPHQLSGGQQQRVAIARALVNQPVLLFADEPTGNISSQQAEEVMGELDQLNRDGVTVILVTHEPDIAAHAKRVITMKDGKVVSDKLNETARSGEVSAKASAEAFQLPRQPLLPSFASFRENLRMAATALSLNKFRTFLTMLGMIVGVATVIAVTALGNGMAESTKAALASLGSNLLMVQAENESTRGTGSAPRFTIPDAEKMKQLEKAGGSILRVDPTVRGDVMVSYGDNNWDTSVTGCEPNYADMRNSVPIEGRFFTQEENLQRARVCLLGKTVVTNLFPAGFDPVGAQVEINKTNYTVLGILPVKGSNGFSDQDDLVLVPLQTAMYRVLGVNYLRFIDVEAKDAASVDPAIDELTAFLREERHILPGQADDFRIRNMADIQQARSSITGVMSTTLLIIACISLLLGGIGIMNIMLVSVKERTKEIGLRKALGARNVEVLFQFLVEALLICMLGGALGIFLGAGASLTVAKLANWLLPLSWGMIVMAVVVSSACGMIFGFWPAWQASKLSPIEALRYE